MKDFEKIIREKGLPEVGQEVRSKKYGTVWRVMEKKEIWANILPDPQSGEPRMVPAIYLMFWRVKEGERPGVGKMMGYEYTLYDNTFSLNWDIVAELALFNRTGRCSIVGARAHACGPFLAPTPWDEPRGITPREEDNQ